MTDTLKKEAAALGFSFQTKLDQASEATIVFQSHVAQDTPEGEINRLLLKAYNASSYLKAIYDFNSKSAQAKDLRKQITNFIADSEGIEARAREEWARTNPDRPYREKPATVEEKLKAQNYLARGRSDLKLLEDEVEELRKKIAMTPS